MICKLPCIHIENYDIGPYGQMDFEREKKYFLVRLKGRKISGRRDSGRRGGGGGGGAPACLEDDPQLG